jgi:hypothetical protein
MTQNESPDDPERESRFKTEVELRDWYSRAEAGTLEPPMTPEEARIMTEELIAAGCGT